MPYPFRKCGAEPAFALHKSNMTSIVGDYGCPKRFRYEMDAAFDRGDSSPDEHETISGKMAAGTAVHETIARALTSEAAREAILSARWIPNRDNVKRVFWEEFERETATRKVIWYGGDNESDVLDDAIHMIVGLLSRLHERVERVVLVEPGFIAKLGAYWLAGHIDLIYVPKQAPRTIALADWKSTDKKPAQLDLDHSWEAGFYSAALRHGTFLPRESIEHSVAPNGHQVAKVGAHVSTHPSRYIAERQAIEAALVGLATGESHPDATRLEQFPSSIHYVALHAYVPYEKAGSKAVTRLEDLSHYGYDTPPKAKHKYKSGDLRGGAWCNVALRETDLVRLEARLRNVVGMIRMGRFIDQIGVMRCGRCKYARVCLNDGFESSDDESKELARDLRGVDMTTTDALSADE